MSNSLQRLLQLDRSDFPERDLKVLEDVEADLHVGHIPKLAQYDRARPKARIIAPLWGLSIVLSSLITAISVGIFGYYWRLCYWILEMLTGEWHLILFFISIVSMSVVSWALGRNRGDELDWSGTGRASRYALKFDRLLLLNLGSACSVTIAISLIISIVEGRSRIKDWLGGFGGIGWGVAIVIIIIIIVVTVETAGGVLLFVAAGLVIGIIILAGNLVWNTVEGIFSGHGWFAITILIGMSAAMIIQEMHYLFQAFTHLAKSIVMYRRRTMERLHVASAVRRVLNIQHQHNLQVIKNDWRKAVCSQCLVPFEKCRARLSRLRWISYYRCILCQNDKEPYAGVMCSVLHLDERLSTKAQQAGSTLIVNGLHWLERHEEQPIPEFDEVIVRKAQEYEIEEFLVVYTNKQKKLKLWNPLLDSITCRVESKPLPDEATIRILQANFPLVLEEEKLPHQDESSSLCMPRKKDSRHVKRILRVAIPVALIAFSIAGFLGYQTWESWKCDKQYQAAISSLDAEQWETARLDLSLLHNMACRQNYDFDVLVRESYYRPAVLAMNAGLWEDAREQLDQLISIDPDYQDALTLIRESYYQPISSAFEEDGWDEARDDLQLLVAIDPDYKDVQSLLRESYYRPALAAYKKKRWEDARKYLVKLIALDSDYKDVQTLLRSSYYLQAKTAMEGEEWRDACDLLESLHALEENFRDTLVLLSLCNRRLYEISLGTTSWSDAIHFQSESYYFEALSAYQEQRWEEVHAALTQLLSIHTEYKDAQSLLQESLYMLIRGAIDAEQWKSAASAIIELQDIQHVFKNIPELIASNSELRLELAIAYASHWVDESYNPEIVYKLLGHTDKVQGVIFSPDGQILASASFDGTVRLWRLIDGELLHLLDHKGLRVHDIAFSDDGAMLAAAVQDNAVWVWNVKEGSVSYKFTEHTEDVWGVAFSPGGDMIASAALDQTVRIWQESNRREIEMFDLPGYVYAAAFSPDGQLLASSCTDQIIRIWKTASWQKYSNARGHPGTVKNIVFSPDSQLISSISEGVLRLWNTTTGEMMVNIEDASIGGRAAFSPDGSIIGTGSAMIFLWQVSDGNLVRQFSDDVEGVTSFAFSPDGSLLAAGTYDGKVAIWRVIP